MPRTFEVSATLPSARVAAGDSVGLIVVATNTGPEPIKVPVRFPVLKAWRSGPFEVTGSYSWKEAPPIRFEVTK
jgi:hypothetical protein